MFSLFSQKNNSAFFHNMTFHGKKDDVLYLKFENTILKLTKTTIDDPLFKGFLQHILSPKKPDKILIYGMLKQNDDGYSFTYVPDNYDKLKSTLSDNIYDSKLNELYSKKKGYIIITFRVYNCGEIEDFYKLTDVRHILQTVLDQL